MLLQVPSQAPSQDVIAEIHHLPSPNQNYKWVLDADITACFDEIDHTALMGQVRRRAGTTGSAVRLRRRSPP
jgi:retron-type reverse transcriptase